nr:PREDICTED: uncharacterized protein LOC109034258 isoform X1 [Bemisia tabaci]XP_018902843.1 PREDICTED: uncharacterized protein LOC109034258 isoform X1 [Bemisia tabaci]XP_018902844.1 PREDICTED: uncharacterized protein LOC109034258 isoform X1 [Bemisia tabaci]XP_018902846.1 PREDICTED: uncharacterized protein LOC109034258 isoform X1 [Bemisia tabaci]XP_018902847.1 PREDICTED: uncharacterized protein LOC109034258 isoform X1 [Bemisia tabaci]XP_018902848.1 PREDICTED: uncharacterized protein LOC1090342
MSVRDLEQGEYLLDEKTNGQNGVIVTSTDTPRRGSYWSNNPNEDANYYQNLLDNKDDNQENEKNAYTTSKLSLQEKPAYNEKSDAPGYNDTPAYSAKYSESEKPGYDDKYSPLFKVTLVCLDYLLSSFVVAPLVVGCWLSLWMIIDAYPMIFLEVNSYLFGSALIFVLTLVREDVVAVTMKLGEKRCQSWCYAVLARVYVYVFFFCGILQWRSLWCLLDFYFDKDVRAVTGVTLVSLAVVVVLKMPESLLAPPYFVGKDTNPVDVFVFPTWFSLSPKDNNIVLYSLDCFFSVFIIGSLLVFVWRGAWTLIDIFLYPGDPVFSAWYSLVIGYIVVFTTFALQPVVKKLVKKLEGFWRLCIVDAYLIFSFTGTINVWRGIWNLLSAYFIPSSPTTAAWVCHVGCFILLILINSSNSVLVRGVYVDAEEEGSKCVDFPCYYLRLFFLARRKKHLLRQFQKKQIHSLKRRKSEVDGYSGATESSAPQKSKVEEPPV